MKNTHYKKAFTLVEILVVIAIMAVLTAIVYTSFNGAKSQSKDQQRVSDMNVIQLGLEVYFNQKHQYPQNLPDVVALGYMPSIPTPPTSPSGINYQYNYFPMTTGGNVCISYQLWTTFENTNSYLQSKRNFDSTATPLANGMSECGTIGHPKINAATAPLVYDVMPQ